jgi:hypothetical protein
MNVDANDSSCNSPYIERYKTCLTAADITKMQDTIMEELEKSWNDSRKEKGLLFFSPVLPLGYPGIDFDLQK